MTSKAISAVGSLFLTAAAPAAPPIADLRPVALHSGVNRVPGFLVGGGTATIIQAWRDNGNAHGHFVWMVLARGPAGRGDAVVEFEGRHGDPDVITASPFDGERVTADVRFATGVVGGKRVSLAIEAWLDEAPSGVIADHATADIRWYELVHRADTIGEAPDAFVPIGAIRTGKRYCNADLALRDSASVPLPADFAGANRVDGCFPDGR